MKKVLFISSTGGHFSELLQLKPLFEKYDSYIITEKDKTSENYKNIYGNKFYYFDDYIVKIVDNTIHFGVERCGHSGGGRGLCSG